MDFIGFKTIFVKYLMMGNWLSFIFNNLNNLGTRFSVDSMKTTT